MSTCAAGGRRSGSANIDTAISPPITSQAFVEGGDECTRGLIDGAERHAGESRSM